MNSSEDFTKTGSGAEQESRPAQERSETSSPSPETPQRPTTEAEKFARVGELLTGTEPNSSPDQEDSADETPAALTGERREGEEDAAAEPATPDASSPGADAAEFEWTPKGIAEKLGTTPDKLYDMELTTGDGETVTLGALKDAYVATEAAERETAERHAALDERETSLAKDQQLLGLTLQELGHKLTPQIVDRVRARATETQDRERALMVQVVPELANSASREAFTTELAEVMGQYGFRPNELNLQDHRLVWFARDALRAMKKLKGYRETPPEPVKKEPPKTHRPRGGQRPGKTGATPRTEADKMSAVAGVLSRE